MNDLDLFKEYYDKYERDSFSRLNGSFACAIVEKDEEVVPARDHVGARPLFFGHTNSIFYFSTEMKGLVDHQNPRSENRRFPSYYPAGSL